MSKFHTKLSSQLVITLLVSSEIAFCGGICSFSFAFTMGDNEIPVIATVIPFLAISSILSIASSILSGTTSILAVTLSLRLENRAL